MYNVIYLGVTMGVPLQTPERQTPDKTKSWNYEIFLWMKYDKIHKLQEKKSANILEKILNL